MDLDARINLLASTYHLHIGVLLFLFVAAGEMLAPAHAQHHSILRRWAQNFGLILVNGTLMRPLQPVLAAAVAAAAGALDLGLFRALTLPVPVVLAISLLLLDLHQYVLHRLLHATRWGWRIHRVHHSDLDYDLSTGFRFHPAEAVLTSAWHLLLIGALGIPVAAVLLRSLLVLWADLFTHGNVRLPPRLDSALRSVFVTPNMHSLHHSLVFVESNRNFGTWLSIWDRLFGSYAANASKPWSELDFGITELREPRAVGLLGMLLMPLRDLPAPPGPDATALK